MKRIFTVILAVCMLLSIAPVTMAADTADGGYQKGDIIEFGSYPQSKVTDPRIISVLDGFLTDDVWVSYDYYIGTGTEYDGKMTASDYMKYADLELNGEKYRAVRFSQYRPILPLTLRLLRTFLIMIPHWDKWFITARTASIWPTIGQNAL